MAKSENPVDHVLDRMVEAMLGENAHFKSHAEALGIPAETIKTWRRRREVPAGRLAEFARDWKTPVDWLLHGNAAERASVPHQVNQATAPYGERLRPDESAILEAFRSASPELRAAALRMLDAKTPAAAPKVRQPRSGGAVERVSTGSYAEGRSRGKGDTKIERQ